MVDSPSDISPMLSPAKAAPRGGKRAQNIDSSLILQGSRSRRPPEKYVANVNEDESEEDQVEKNAKKFDQLNDSYSNWMLKKQQKQEKKKRKRVESDD